MIQNAWLRICHIWNDQEEERVIESSNDKLHAQFKISRLLFKQQQQKSCKLVMTRVKHARDDNVKLNLWRLMVASESSTKWHLNSQD